MSQKISALHEEVENSSFYITVRKGKGSVALKGHGNETDLLIFF